MNDEQFTPSYYYFQSLAVSRKAAEVFQAVQAQFCDGKLSAKDFLSARAQYDDAMTVFDNACADFQLSACSNCEGTGVIGTPDTEWNACTYCEGTGRKAE